MKKSILSIVLLVTMLLSIMAPLSVSAASVTLKEFLDNNGLATIIANGNKDQVYVPANIQLKNSAAVADTAYQSSDIYIELPSNDPATFPTFDFRATLDMSPVRTAFSQYYDGAELLINSRGGSDTASLLAELRAVPVSGQFTVEVLYSAGLEVPLAGFINQTDMYGFKIKDVSGNYIDYTEAGNIYEEVSRTDVAVTAAPGATENWRKLTITIAVKAPNPGSTALTGGDLKDNLNTYLADLALECKNVKPGASNVWYKVNGSVTGNTKIGGDTPTTEIANIIYNAHQEGQANTTAVAERKVLLSFQIYTPGSGRGDRGSSTKKQVKLSFDINGKTEGLNPIVYNAGATVDYDALPRPTREGYAFDGFYFEPDYLNKATGKQAINKDTILYGRWHKTEAPSVLNSEDHFAYIAGYPNYEIRPFDNISREEIATIFYRLLKDEVRKEIHATSNDFSDVESDRWSNAAISTIANGGYVVGYQDGTFRPEAYITRAEFVTVASRFNAKLHTEGTPFSDIAGHWAESYIITAATEGWVDGYEDGTFKPDEYITRADAIQIINRLLVRYVNKEGLHADATQWIDNFEDSEYYYDILEATNSHIHERQEDGYNENWPELIDETFVIDELFYEE